MTYSTSDIDVAARTAWGECRSGGSNGMIAVLWVIKNRVNHPGWWGHDVFSVCKAKSQFDCWFPGDPNYAKLLAATPNDPSFALALKCANDVFNGDAQDPTGGATSYYAKTIPAPYWAKGKKPLADIGNQLYFA